MTAYDKETIWREVLENVKVSVSPAIFSTWFSQTYLSNLEPQGAKRIIAQVGCSSSFVKTTIESRYFGIIQDTLAKSLGKACDLIFVVKENPNKTKVKKGKSDTPTPLFEKREKDQEEIAEALAKSKIRPGFTFENFAVSSSNQMAWAAAEAVSQSPGSAYNPLFLWGGVGVGKSHLLLAIGHFLISKDPSSNLLFCTGEEFTNEIVEGIRNKSTQEFRKKYRKLKALLIDDIQFIAGKDAVQEEFFHTFNALASSGSQVVLVSDKPPSEISRLEERLQSRFEAGLNIDISPPDFELRCAICQIKAKDRGIDLPMDLVQVIAGNISSARKIEGFLVRLISEARTKSKDLSEDLIISLFAKKEDGDGQKIKATPNELINAVSRYFSVGKRALLGEGRARPVALPRQILMYLLRIELKLPLQEVGRLVGDRDHTTVMHAVDKITQLASKDVQIRQDILGIKNGL